MQFLLKLFGMLSAKQKTALLGSLAGVLGSAAGGGGGGLADILGKLRGGGLSSQVDSWLGTGANQKVSGAQLSSALGPDMIGKLARDAGVSEKQAAGGLAKMLPGIIDKLSPGGQLADGDQLGGLLKNLPGLLGR